MSCEDCEIELISASDLKSCLDKHSDVFLLDVREPRELDICTLKYTMHIPIGDLRFNLDKLEPFKQREIVIYCRTGRRSGIAAEFLQEKGFNNVKSLQGGIVAYSDQVDPSLTKY